MRYVVRPISDRTAFQGNPTNSQFKVTWSTALDLLGRELDALHAEEIVLELDVPERGIRLDGQVRADAVAASPAVRLAFETPTGPLTFATDRFVRPSYYRSGMQKDWQHNVYAIAGGLEALRKVDRYGITERGEQYAGFAQLPAGSGAAASHMTRQDAADLLERLAVGDTGDARVRSAARILRDADVARKCLRHARAIAHPDRNGGERAAWDQVEQAATVLGLS